MAVRQLMDCCKWPALMALVIALAVGCGGGGGGQLPVGKSANPDASKIAAERFTLPDGFSITGAADSVEPFALVTVRDPGSVSASTTADASGAWAINAVPGNFETAVGTVLGVTQIAPQHTESDPVSVTVVAG